MDAGTIDKTVAEIITSDGSIVLVDASDVERVQGFSWTVRRGKHGHAYAVTKWKTKTLLMHRLILDVPQGHIVDHANNNGLDNRRCNLRVCTHAENMRNRKVHKNSASGRKGVRYNGNTWEARITINGRRIGLGSFATRDKAHEAYKAAAAQYHGEFANPGDRQPVDIRSSSERTMVSASRPVRSVNDLSRTQKDILGLLASGMMPTEIAAQLGVAVNTVSTHIKRIKARLGAKSTIHAAVMWARATDAAIAEYESWSEVFK